MSTSEVSTANSPQVTNHLQGRQILVVDDDPEIRVLLRKRLEKEGLQVAEADSVANAEQALNADIPHIVITDIRMPKQYGFRLLETRQKSPILKKVPFLVLSGVGDRNTVQRSFALGATDYLVKPVDMDSLVQKIRKALKDKSFPSVRTGDHPPKGKITINGRVLQAGPKGMVVATPVKLGADSKLTLETPVVDKLGIKNRPLFPIPELVDLSDDGLFLNHLAINRELISELKEKTGQKLRTGLLVDDDKDFAHVVKVYLKDVGVDLEVTPDPREFIRRIKNGAPPDICFVDLNIGKIQLGFRLVDAIRSTFGKELPVFIISSTTDPASIAHALEVGATDYIKKPIEKEPFQNQIRSFFEARENLTKGLGGINISDVEAQTIFDLGFDLIEIDEFGIKIRGPDQYLKGSKIFFSCAMFNQIYKGSDLLPARVANTAVHKETGTYWTLLEFEAESTQLRSEVRKWIASKASLKKSAKTKH